VFPSWNEWIQAWTQLLTLSRPWAGLLTVAGGLVLVFSWLIDNTLKDKYSKLAQALESGKTERNLFGIVSEIRQSVSLIEFEVLRKSGLQSADDPFCTQLLMLDHQLLSIRNRVDEVRELNETMSRGLQSWKKHPSKSRASLDVERVSREVGEIYANLVKLDQAADNAMKTANSCRDSDSLHSAIRAVCDYEAAFQKEYRPRNDHLWKDGIEALNQRASELEVKLKWARRWMSLFGRLRGYLYVFGSALAIYGQYLEKTKSS